MCVLVYAVAAAAAVGVVLRLRGMSSLVQAAVADVVATLVVFVGSRIMRNSSIYDPYWSVVPPALAALWMHPGGWTPVEIMVAVLVLWWGARLTLNWIRRWRGLRDEDFRYQGLKSDAGALEAVVDLLGIHLFPTVQVFLGCLSIYLVAVASSERINAAAVLAAVVTVAAILIETVSDRQLREFRSSAGDGILQTGLWGIVRHPNYVGEILFWWGLWIFTVGAGAFMWWSLIGPVAITVMFALVSVPMMDRHLCEKNPAYREHVERSAALVPGVY